MFGNFKAKNYPWTPIKMCTRNEEMISAANEMLKQCSKTLEIRHSLFTNAADKSQCFGMFAKKPIRKEDIVLDSFTVLAASNRQHSVCYNCIKPLALVHAVGLPCCPNMKYCGDKCLETAKANYHKVMCGKNFDKIYEKTGRQNLEIGLYLRLLAICVQAGEHPLENISISWLSTLTAGHRFKFALAKDIIAPIQILKELGADIFDPKYDYWVLFSVWYVSMAFTDISSERPWCFKNDFQENCAVYPWNGSQLIISI